MQRTLFVFLVAGIASFGQDNSASIQGSLMDATTNKPVSGAFVAAVRNGLPPLSQVVQSAVDGSFQMQHLPAGTYKLCAQVPGGTYLDPCKWSANPPQIDVARNQKSSGTVLKLQTGSVVKVIVQDAGQWSTKQLSGGYLPSLLVGVSGPRGDFHPAHLASRGAGGDQNYQLVVPRDLPLSLQVRSTHLRIADSSGAALAGNMLQQQFQHPTGDANPKSFTFTVLGLLP